MIFKIYLYLLLFVSIITFWAFAIDKKHSKKEEAGRIPEMVLLSLINFGGAAGGLCGIYILRHKTNFKTKFHFAFSIWISLITQALLAVFILYKGV